MNKRHIILIFFFITISHILHSQEEKTDANIIGHVVCCGQHIPFATVLVKGTAIGTTTDESGHYQLINLPEGTFTIVARSVGYKPCEKEISITKGETKEIKFELEEDVLGLEEVVVTSDRNSTNRKNSSVIVNTISPKLFTITQSVTLSEGLNFSPGLRTEANCQNCGFAQVRMNGMKGPYSQILINNRPIFSGLAAVYGLELIPSNMIERVEVVRGGGSALYGSNAIAGTINLILKDPINNSYEFGINSGLVGFGMKEADRATEDHSVNFNTSLVSADNKTGMSLYGFYRDRKPFDANDDGFSELTSIKNTTIGTRLYHRFGARSKLTADFFNIKEERRGGNKHDNLLHQADIAEAVDHSITSGALTFEKFFRGHDLFSVFVSGQGINRNSYYGAGKSLKDYGVTKDFSFTAGAQYNAHISNSNIVIGIENNGAWLKDKKMGYPDLDGATINFSDSSITIPEFENRIIAEQYTNTLGIFAQYEIKLNKVTFSAGGRFDNYRIDSRKENNADQSGDVLSPRLTVKYDILDYLQARISYAHGYRAPQIFNEDLHIETSGARQVIHRNDPDLEKETSHSYMASLDFNKKFDETSVGFLIEAFYTKLNNPFASDFGVPDETGTVIYTRVNAKNGAVVQGMNVEINVIPTRDIALKGGFTIQTSHYEEVREFGEKSFFRTPDDYGYVTLDWKPFRNFRFSTSGNYTGKMLVPYFGNKLQNPEEGELRTSERFFDLGMKVSYKIKLNGASLKIFTGVKNMFNSYQHDFDRGIDRDPGYIYGPVNPRTVYAGLKIGNFFR